MRHSSPAVYIHLVQHMIETCLTFNMSKEECMEALSENANINPIITSTVWKELVKENKDFFETYEQKLMKKESMSEEETNQLIQNIISL
ncbi:unnamed protein product [Arabidopsis thaliana]|uniref:Angiotensin-converting enzyme 2 n=1 Tax=Arabidopsis thaliana TaxID=3702 RepID=Q9MBG6_ARATH|nr:Plant protein 1589 of unknown function [Arabidopsis thaliana]AEE77518.1 Plant protein 1589 of unknown function [Arabidopsis thaliana]BAA95752.1 unnamed protein product [Arabidopsis thaliana]|eukprot:NP_189541.1 Plant protein 1589 of unknown function [Arabidopsis thaliana]